jgi:hypothetical protein
MSRVPPANMASLPLLFGFSSSNPGLRRPFTTWRSRMLPYIPFILGLGLRQLSSGANMLALPLLRPSLVFQLVIDEQLTPWCCCALVYQLVRSCHELISEKTRASSLALRALLFQSISCILCALCSTRVDVMMAPLLCYLCATYRHFSPA